MSGSSAGDDGRVEAAISTAMVKLLHGLTGRGPPRARTTVGEDVILCLLSATLTKGERTLADHERVSTVLRGRQEYQDIMSVEAIAVVEELTGRTVSAFMSANHIDPDLAAEIFVLAPRS